MAQKCHITDSKLPFKCLDTPTNLALKVINHDVKNYISSLHKAAILAYAPLKVVQIYFDTATYDEIGRDVKVIGEETFILQKPTN